MDTFDIYKCILSQGKIILNELGNEKKNEKYGKLF